MRTFVEQITSYYRSVYTTILYRQIITVCHIISLCYTDNMFRTGNVHLQVLHLNHNMTLEYKICLIV
jgi:hypothetical protein